MLNAWLERAGLLELNEWTILLRIGLAAVLGGLLGLERTRKRRAAGMRTYTLVCLGAASVMMTGQFMFQVFGGTDPARLGAQVISGIGFLGAGTILITGAQRIKGLTTAACLWAAACMGITIGIGFYVCSILMFVAIILVMTVLNLLQAQYIGSCKNLHLYVIFESLKDVKSFIGVLQKIGIVVEEFELESSLQGIGICAQFQLHIKERRQTHADVMRVVNDCSGLLMAIEI